MDKNVGSGDRLFRIVVGAGIAALIYLAPLTGTAALVAGIISVYLLATALLSRCLFYKFGGIDTSHKEVPYSTTDDRAGL